MKRRKGVPLHKYGIFFVFILCLAGMCSLCVSADDHTEKKEKAEYIQNEDVEVLILSILVYTLFSRMFDLMQPPAVKHSIAVV